jgi:hypothetical protein
MLKFGKDFDETTRVHMYLAGRLAQNEDGLIYLTCSKGRRRSGRPAYYWLHRKALMMAKRFTAWDDDEALEIANRMAEALVTPAPVAA